MNKKIFIFLMINFFAYLSFLSSESTAHKKVHNNHLYFLGKGVHSLTFTVKKSCITKGQHMEIPPEGRLTLTKNNKLALSNNKQGKIGINIRAGRHQSKGTAFCIKQTMFHAPNGNKHYVDFHYFFEHFSFTAREEMSSVKLNFAVQGALTINGKQFDDIVLAQGHTALTDNWWFGGSHCHQKVSALDNIKSSRVYCQ